MKRALRYAAFAVALAALAGCVSITKAPAGPMALGEGRPLTLDRDWSDISALVARTPSVRVLTLDGLALNRLYIASGLKPGEGLFKAISKEKPQPSYRKDMSGTELIEFITDTVTAHGYQRVETTALKPARLWGADGVRVEFEAKTEGGLEISGVAEVAQVGDRLGVILFLAPTEHYFGATVANVEAVFRSAS